MSAIPDRVEVNAYGALANRILYDCIKSLRQTPGQLNRAAAVILHRTEHTQAIKLFWANYRIHEGRCRLKDEILFVESGMFETLCTALDIDPEKAYKALQRKYAEKCKAALDMAAEADRAYIAYIENK